MYDARKRWLIGGAAVALGVVVAFSVWAGSVPYAQIGNGDPGPVVSIGAPVLRLVSDLAATVCVGALVFVAFCTRPGRLLTGPAYGEVRCATVAAGVWMVSVVLLIPFSAADTGGVPLATVMANLPGFVGALEQPKAWLCTAVLVLVVFVGTKLTLRWQPAVLWGAVAVFAVLPPLVTAHGSSDTGHDLSLAAIVIHVPAAMIWFGLLLAVLRRRAGAELVRRYDRIALCCWVSLALSGLVLGAVLVPPGQLFSTAYGLALVAKVVLAVAAGVVGRVAARRAARGRVVVFASAEVLLLAAVVGFSVGLSHLPLPDFLGRVLSTAQTLLGYDLSGPPTLTRLLTDWRPDLFFGPLAVVLLVGYLLAVRGRAWPRGRTVAWVAGCLVLILATCSGIGRYAAAMFSVHLAAHMLVSMLVPALLVQGAPLTLFRVPPWFDRTVRALTHPVVALGLFAGSPFLLYFTGLFDAAVRFHWAHLLIDAWFLAVGYLFCWLVVGEDPLPRPLPGIGRLGLVLAAMPADILFGALLMGTGRIVGNGTASSNMYQALALPWVRDLVADQRAAGLVALAIGEVTLLMVLGVLLARWRREDETGYEALARNLRPEFEHIS